MDKLTKLFRKLKLVGEHRQVTKFTVYFGNNGFLTENVRSAEESRERESEGVGLMSGAGPNGDSGIHAYVRCGLATSFAVHPILQCR